MRNNCINILNQYCSRINTKPDYKIITYKEYLNEINKRSDEFDKNIINIDTNQDDELFQNKPNKTRIVCMGDSITKGTKCTDMNLFSYPVQLQNYINDCCYEVINYGVGGATMIKDADCPYWNKQEYKLAMDSHADIYILMLGTNDSKEHNWNQYKYTQCMKHMIKSILNLKPTPQLYVMIPPPLYKNKYLGMQQMVINCVLPTIIPKIALSLGLKDYQIINLFENMGGIKCDKWEYFQNGTSVGDPCHPNNLGYAVIAGIVYKHLFAYKNPFKASDKDQPSDRAVAAKIGVGQDNQTRRADAKEGGYSNQSRGRAAAAKGYRNI